jgi:hypothetical protein
MVNKNYYLANAGRPERVINKQQALLYLFTLSVV